MARVIRHASYFHWQQFLDLHFNQWDKDKYLELSVYSCFVLCSVFLTRTGKFLFDNYKQALDIISRYTPEVEAFKTARGITDNDFESWRLEELEYLQAVSSEPEHDALTVTYVEALQALRKAEYVYHHFFGISFVVLIN